MSITKKDAEIQAESIVRSILNEKNQISSLLNKILAKEDSVRYPNAIALEILSENYPKIIYSEWNFFVNLLKSKNAYHRSIAIFTISNLITIDEKNEFEKIFKEYFKLIDDKSVIVTRKLAIYAWRIAIAKPKFRAKITEILLNIDNTHHNPSRKDLIKGDIIQSFSEYFEEIKEKNKIFDFIKKQLNSSSPSTVKRAEEFLAKWVV